MFHYMSRDRTQGPTQGCHIARDREDPQQEQSI